MLSYILGFLIPFRYQFQGDNLFFISGFDAAFAIVLPLLVIKKKVVVKSSVETAPLILFSVIIMLSAEYDNISASLFTIYAVFAGYILTTLERIQDLPLHNLPINFSPQKNGVQQAADRTDNSPLQNENKLVDGLRAGTFISIIISLPIYLFKPELFSEGGFYSALFGSKNGLAFITGLLAVNALEIASHLRHSSLQVFAITRWIKLNLMLPIRLAESNRRKGEPICGCSICDSSSQRLFQSATVRESHLIIEFVFWFIITLLTESRMAVIGLGICILPFFSLKKWRIQGSPLLISLTASITALLFLIQTEFPSDRFYFIIDCIKRIEYVPLFGIGAGNSYGLDLYFKSLIEFGWIGFIIIIWIIVNSLRKQKIKPLLLYVLLFGLAHNPTRWPLFWYLVLF